MSNSEEPSLDENFVREITQSQTALRSYIRKLAGGRAECDDILQETNLVIFKKRMDWDPTTVFLKWAYRIAYFQTKSYFRDKSRIEGRFIFSENMMEILADETPFFETDSALRSALDHCLSKFRKDKRELLLQRYLPEASVEALALANGFTPNSMSQLLRRLRTSLSRCIHSQMDAAA